MSNMPLRIMTRDFQLLDEVDLYSSLQITRSWHGIGQIELVINRYLKGADKLQRGHIIFPHNHLDKGFIIRHKEIELDENGKATENWVIRALSLKSWIAQRLTYPLPDKMTDDIEADAESVIHHYIKNNVTDPIDSERKMPDIMLAENLKRGRQIKWSTRYEDLAEVIEEISKQSGLGWNIEIDTVNKQFIFKVLEGRDLTVNQSELPPSIFSTEFGTLGSMSYMESDLDYKSVAIVEGPDKPNQDDVSDEEKEKYMTTVGDGEGFNRYEMLVGANVDTEIEVEENEREPRPEQDIIADMIEVGETGLEENTQEIYVEGQVAMGRVTEKAPKNIEGSFKDVRLDEVDLWGEGRNLFDSKYLSNRDNYDKGAYATTKKVWQLEPNTVYTLSSRELKGFGSDEWGVLNIMDGTNGAIKFREEGYTILSTVFNKRGVAVPTEPVKNFTHSFQTPESGKIYFSYYDHYSGSSPEGYWFTDKLVDAKLEKGPTATPWQPAPEDGIPWYETTKTLTLPSINLSRLGKYQSSKFTFDINEPTGTSAIVEYSLDNQTWHRLNSGDSLPFNQGDWLKDAVVYLRQRLSTNNQAVTPTITNFSYEINGYHEREYVSTARLAYQKDYDLGDMGTLQSKDWGITMDARITEVKEIYEPGNIKIDLTFDNSFPTLIDKIKKEIRKR